MADEIVLLGPILRLKVVFLAKADYFDKWYLRWFFKAANVIPVRREVNSSAQAALDSGAEALRQGKLIGIFPEGTRSPDGRLYRGKTGVARMVLEARAPVVPVAIVGTFEPCPTIASCPSPAEWRSGSAGPSTSSGTTNGPPTGSS